MPRRSWSWRRKRPLTLKEFCNTAYSASLAILTKAERFPLKVPTMYSTGRLMLKMQSDVVWCYFKQKVPLWSFAQYCSI
uniref:Uncharacterized protein n=1 Tax=Canis lupus dingo TaxID=286419 RepID=A0A8C0R7B8_CANLU